MRAGSEIVGYIASGLVLLTFTTTEMRPLRVMAILSNLAFIGYGLLDEILPVLALHIILFPLNVFRLAQLEIAKTRVQEAPHREASPEIVSPHLFVYATGAIVRGIEPVGESHWEITASAADRSFQIAVAIAMPTRKSRRERLPIIPSTAEKPGSGRPAV